MKTQLTSHKQKQNANTSLEEWNYAQKKKKNPSPNSSPTFISSDSEGCISVCSMATVSRKSDAKRSAGSEDFQSVRKLSQTKHRITGFTASVGA